MQRTVILAVLACAALSACGGGGGGGGPGPGDGITTPAPPSTTIPPSNPTPPSVTSAEYRRSWGLGAINANAAFDYGATGQGITVAVIDTGVDASQPDLAGRVSSQSTDIDTARHNPTGVSRHGTEVAGVIAANFDGSGTIGVAYEATILGVRADDTTGSTCPDDGCQFSDFSLARAIDYAVAHGAKVINMSLGGDERQSSGFEAALARARAAGVIVTASAGNDSAADPGWPARYATDPRFVGYVIAVGATAVDGSMADFSNRAGVSAEGYLAAPGDDIVTDCDGTSCWRVGGTSFASPHVAGALALLLEAFPNLTGPEAVDILLRTAADRGVTGTDSTWGRGVLDLARAFSPIGALDVPTPGGGSVAMGEGQGTGVTSGLAFGDALMVAQALTTIGHDDYDRLFKVELGARFAAGPGGLVGATPATHAVSTTAPVARGVTFALQAETPLFPDEKLSAPMLDLVRGEAPQSVLATAQVGRFSFSAWRGQGGAPRPQSDGARDAFRLLASPDETVSVGYRIGAWTLSAEQGAGERREFMALQTVDGPAYVSGTAAWSHGATTAAFTAGSLSEPQGPLGSDIRQASLFAMPASTDFAALGVERRLAGLTLRAEASVGRTSADGAWLDIDGALSSQWRLGVYGSRFGLELEQPLRLERGDFTALLADVPAEYFDPVAFSFRRASASPTGRQVNLRASWTRQTADWGSLRLRGVAAVDAGHQADRGLDLGAAVDWRVDF